jgi:cation:H+ antiporter
MTLVWFLAGLGLLVGGAELLVRGASRLAAAMGIAPLVIGLTVVAWGTSAPEVAVSVQAALSGQTDIAVGNVVGSNVFNVLFILGVSATITPLVVSRQLVRLDVPIMVLVSLGLWILAANGLVTRGEGLLMLGGMVAYTGFQVVMARAEARQPGPPETPTAAGGAGSLPGNLARVAVGLVLLVLGARWFVGAAVVFARLLGVSELVIGLTIVAAGTSMPEVATSIVAAVRGQRDIAVGNVVGSSVFNILVVLGGAAAVAPGGLHVAPGVLGFDLPVMAAVAAACLPVFFSGHTIARWEGVVFLAYYVAYTVYLLLASAQHDALPAFSAVMLWFALPLTILTIGVGLVRAVRSRPS